MTDEQIEHLDNAMMFSQFSSKMGAAVEITPQYMNDIRQLIEQHRTLKQQNKQLVETVETAIMWFNSGELFIKGSQMRTMLTHIQSFQGGSSNANS